MSFSWKQTDSMMVSVSDGRQVRLSFSTWTSLGQGRYNQAIGERNRYLTGKYGANHTDRFTEDALLQIESIRTYERAVFFGTLVKVEERPTEADEWTPSDLPEEWKPIENYCEEVPPDVSITAAKIGVELNPGKFLNFGGETEKNAGKLSVTRLLH